MGRCRLFGREDGLAKRSVHVFHSLSKNCNLKGIAATVFAKNKAKGSSQIVRPFLAFSRLDYKLLRSCDSISHIVCLPANSKPSVPFV